MSGRSLSKSRLGWWVVVLLFLVLVVELTSAAGYGSQCAANYEYYCPNCGGINVTNCLSCDGYSNTEENNAFCFNRRLFAPYNDDPTDSDNYYVYLWRDIVATFVWFFAAGVATACGVGGGGIYVPLGMVLLAFAPKPASGLSQASIFGASLGGLALNIRDQNPHTDIKDPDDDSGKTYTRPVIDYDMALFLAPMEMAGAVLGVLIQALLPNWLYLFLAAIILGFTAHKTYKKWWSTRQKEMAKAAANDSTAALSMPAEPDPATSEDSDKGNNEKNGSTDEQGDDEVEEGKAETKVYSAEQLQVRKDLLEKDARQYPHEKLIALVILWIGLIILTFMKGGKGVASIVGITCESPWYGVLIAIQFVWTLGFALVYGLKLPKIQKKKDDCGYPFTEDDVYWDNSKLRFYAFFTFVAGIVAGLIGIGGGMVLGPLMLYMGIRKSCFCSFSKRRNRSFVSMCSALYSLSASPQSNQRVFFCFKHTDPRVSSATTGTMIVLTSSSVAVLFVTFGLVPWQYAVYFFCICFLGALIGKTKIDGYVKKTGKASILIFLLATIIALATLGCVVSALTRLAAADWCFDGFKPFCVQSSEKENAACAVADAAARLLGFVA